MSQRRYPHQIEASRMAHQLLNKMPPNLRWSLSLTEDDDQSSPGTLNIYVPRADWTYVGNKLGLSILLETSDEHVSYRMTACLLVSLIDEEQEDE